eukprot:TRINITY_DN16658_c0_g1_i2.p1 TRINITY_DN16658_c0_g1~~TRINITY_DN16658_c0_g1_i2.p1  ORF type:complete len:338 (+),score=68.38 TRINITY_DN16658_c0_g1_i2:83-1015(+)
MRLSSAQERCDRVLTPAQSPSSKKEIGFDKSTPRKMKSPHGVKATPIDLCNDMEEAKKPTGLPEGETRMPEDLCDHLDSIRRKQATLEGLKDVRKQLIISSSPERTRLSPVAVEEFAPPSPKLSKNMAGHLMKPLSDSIRKKEIDSSPVNDDTNILRKGDIVKRNPRYWKWGSQDSHGEGVVKDSPSNGWVWVTWDGTSLTGCYRYGNNAAFDVQKVRDADPLPVSPVFGSPKPISRSADPSPFSSPTTTKASSPKMHLQCPCHQVVILADRHNIPAWTSPPRRVAEIKQTPETRKDDICNRVAAVMLTR